MSNKRRIPDSDDDVILMPPPPKPTAKPVLYYPEDDDQPPTQVLAPPSSPPRQPSVAAPSSRPAFGRFSSTGPRRRSALDNIGYAPENIPTPRITRPRSITTGGTGPSTGTGTGTGKRRRGLKISAVATTSPVQPARQRAPSPSKQAGPSSKLSDDEDDDDYVVDSSDNEEPVRFNLPSEDAPRSSKIARTSTGDTSTSTRPQPTPSTKRRNIGTTPARRSKLALQAGITPARSATSSALVAGTEPRPAPIPLNLPQSRPTFRPSLPAEASPFVSSPVRARVVSQRPPPTAGSSRISELRDEPGSSSAAKPASSSAGVSRAFSTTGARNVSSLAETGADRPPSPSTGNKRAPGSKSHSPPGAKRPRVATPSPPAAEDVIIVSSSDEEEEVGAGTPAEERRPSPSPSLGDYRPTPAHSRSRTGSGSASSDIVLLEPPPKEPAGPSHESLPAPDPPRASTPPPVVPRQPSTPKDAPRPKPPSTPTTSRHSSSSEKQSKPAKRPLKKVPSIESIQPIIGRRIGTGRRQRIRREIQNTEPAPSPSPEEISSRSSKEAEAPSRPVASSSRQPENRPKPTPFRREGGFAKPVAPVPSRRVESPSRTTRSPSPPWTGKPLFRPPTTAASGLTPFRELSPRTASVRPTPGPSHLPDPEPSKSAREPTKRPEIDTSPSAVAKRTGLVEDDDEDPLSALYDEPPRQTIAGASIFGPPQYLVEPREPRAPPSESPFTYSHISSVPPPTILSPSIAPPRRRYPRLDCVLLPRASKAVRRALERSAKRPLTIEIPKKLDKGKGKAKDDSPSEFPSPETSSESQTGSSSTAGPGPAPPPPPPVVKYLVIDPQLADSSNYPSLPPEIVESPDKYCHCCRARGGAGKLKMRCNSLTIRKGVPGSHECGRYWCQRCAAKHDIVFNPLLTNFRCPLCTGTCECDKCRRERGQDPLGRGAHKVVKMKPGKRSLAAFKTGRVASSIASSTAESNTAAEPDVEIGSPEPEPESESESDAPPVAGPAPKHASTSGPTIWHGSRPPPHLRLRLSSGGHVLSSATHIFVKRGPRAQDAVETAAGPSAGSTVDQSTESTIEQSANSTPGQSAGEESAESTVDQTDDSTEPVPEEEGPVEEETWGVRHQAFEGDYMAAGDASLLGADSGTFELEMEHGPSDVGEGTSSPGVHNTGVATTLRLGVEVARSATGESVTASDTAHSTTEGEGETPVMSTVTEDTSRSSTGTPIGGTLAYPPSESSEGSHPDIPVTTPAVPIGSSTHTITGTLDDHTPPPGVLVDTPAASADTPSEISHDTLTRIFHESVQGFAESDPTPTERDYGSTSSSRQYSDLGELQSVTPEAGEPQPKTPDLDELRAVLGLGDTYIDPELADLGQLHPEGTFETVPRISMGDGGDFTLIGSLRDISLFNAVMDCSDDKYGIALSSSQTERRPIVCGSSPPPSYPFDLEPLAIPEMEESESEPEHEPDLVHATDPESTKSTILDTPSPQLQYDTGSDLSELPDLFDSSSDHEPAAPFVFPTKAKRVRMRKLLPSQLAQQAKPATRATRSQTRKSTMERSKFLRSRRCYGVTP